MQTTRAGMKRSPYNISNGTKWLARQAAVTQALTVTKKLREKHTLDANLSGLLLSYFKQ